MASLFAFLHFLFAFGVIFSILYERLILRQEISQRRAHLMRKTDGLYGLSALMVLAIGFIRVFYFEKGSEFYFGNPFFHVKLGLFIIIGLLSIYPSIRFMKWKKLNLRSGNVKLDDQEYNMLRKILNTEIILIALLLLSASLMANGLQF